MANILLDVHTFIAQNLPKYRFQSSLDYTFLSLSVSSIHLLKENICHILDRKVQGSAVFYILSHTIFITANYYEFLVIITKTIQEFRKYKLLFKNYEFQVFHPPPPPKKIEKPLIKYHFMSI